MRSVPPRCAHYELRLMTGRRLNDWIASLGELWDIPDEARGPDHDYIVQFADGLEEACGLIKDRMFHWRAPEVQEEVLPLFNKIGCGIKTWDRELKIGLPIRIVYGRLEDREFYKWLDRQYRRGDLDLFADTPPKLDLSGLEWWLDQARSIGLLPSRSKAQP